MISDSYIFNSLHRKKEKLETYKSGELKFYSCGPTVYNLIHVGNLRSALVSDLFFRYWKSIGYKVQYARNYTDVDDKIIKKANEEGKSSEEVSEFFIQEVEKDYRAAGIQEPTFKPKVTAHIESVIQTISKIIENSGAYVDGQDVIYSVDSFKNYGQLSGKNLDQLIAGSRVEVKGNKKNPLDFYLWKAAKPGEPSWKSPWGLGRPGWHIECSAMILDLLGPKIDVHHGGVDLVFPHHENEIAQSEAASHEHPFSRYWLHHEFVTVNEQKMSKSIGNVFQAREFLDRFGGELARYLMLSPHYRSPIDFSENSLRTALSSLERIYSAKKLAGDLVLAHSSVTEKQDKAFDDLVSKFSEKIDLAYADDFHTPQVLSSFFELIREFNSCAYHLSAREQKYRAKVFIEQLDKHLGVVLGVGGLGASQALDHLHEISKKIEGLSTESVSEDRPTAEEIDALLQERVAARQNKDFARSDEIRDELSRRGVVVKDTPLGAKWSYK